MLEEMFKRHKEEVFSADPTCGLPACCEEEGIAAEYKVHERRPRKFRALIREVVKVFDSYVVRWKCVACGAIYTELPWFGLRHKRYVSKTVMDLSQRQLDGELKSKQAVVANEDGASVTYVKRIEGKQLPLKEQLWRSTVVRWVKWLESLEKTCRAAKRLLRSGNPASQSHRDVTPGQRFQTARDLLRMEKEFVDRFGHSIFPGFARQHDWS